MGPRGNRQALLPILLPVIMAVACGDAPRLQSKTDAGEGCGSVAVLCGAAGVVCGELAVTDFCGRARTLQCGSCSRNGTCDLTGRTCSCNPGYSGNGWTCTVAIGTSCTKGDGTQQNCPAGQVCIGSQGVNTCDIVNCQSDADCGTNGGAPNYCAVTGGVPLCQLSCFPNIPNSCNNPDLVCLPANAAGSTDTSQCAISCHAEPADWCAQQLYGGVCQSNGVCQPNPCKGDSDCPSGSVCYTDVSQLYAQQYCVPDCRLAGNTCPSLVGSCDPMNGTCDLPPAQ
jgi:hypothetical protein